MEQIEIFHIEELLDGGWYITHFHGDYSVANYHSNHKHESFQWQNDTSNHLFIRPLFASLFYHHRHLWIQLQEELFQYHDVSDMV